MTGLTDVRDRTLTMLRALGVDPDDKRMRAVERYVRWVDGQISAAHIDGRALEHEVAGGHEMVVEHDTRYGGSVYNAVCHEAPGADCRLICTVPGCEEHPEIQWDIRGPHHLHVSDPDDAVDPALHARRRLLPGRGVARQRRRRDRRPRRRRSRQLRDRPVPHQARVDRPRRRVAPNRPAGDTLVNHRRNVSIGVLPGAPARRDRPPPCHGPRPLPATRRQKPLPPGGV